MCLHPTTVVLSHFRKFVLVLGKLMKFFCKKIAIHQCLHFKLVCYPCVMSLLSEWCGWLLPCHSESELASKLLGFGLNGSCSCWAVLHRNAEPPHSSNGYSLLKQWLSLPGCFSEDNQNYYWGPCINYIEQFSRKSPQTALGKNMEVCCWGHLKIFLQQGPQQPFFICLTMAMLAVVIDLMVQRVCSASTTFWFLQRFSSWWNK